MVHRLIYIAQHRPDMEAQARKAIAGAQHPASVIVMTVHRFRRNLFFYYECDGISIEPDALFPGLIPYLEPVPCGEEPRHFAQMMDIFHYHVPGETSTWRKDNAGEPWPRLVYLKPDMYASYIFYHWQLQEEQPGNGPKYGVIAAHENLLYFYLERPFVQETTDYPGKLATKNTPGGWGPLMDQHFIPWTGVADDQKYWREDLELLFNARHQFG